MFNYKQGVLFCAAILLLHSEVLIYVLLAYKVAHKSIDKINFSELRFNNIQEDYEHKPNSFVFH